MAGQIEQRLRKCAGGNLRQGGYAGPPMPAADAKQGRLIAPRDRRLRPGRLGMMKQLMGDENIARRRPSHQPHGQIACDRRPAGLDRGQACTRPSNRRPRDNLVGGDIEDGARDVRSAIGEFLTRFAG
jgi:hypothetical protein